MDLFGRFKKLDSSLQRGLDNGFARVFGGEVVPTEIDEVLKQQAEESVMIDSRGRQLAPSYFRVLVSERDYHSLTENRPRLADELNDRLSRFIRNQGWHANGPIQVDVDSHEDLHSGQLRVDARFNAPKDKKKADATAGTGEGDSAVANGRDSSDPQGRYRDGGTPDGSYPGSYPGQRMQAPEERPEWPQREASQRSLVSQDYNVSRDSDSAASRSAAGAAGAASGAAAGGLADLVRGDRAFEEDKDRSKEKSQSDPHGGDLHGGEPVSAQNSSSDSDDLPEPPISYPGTEVIAQSVPDEPIRGGNGEPNGSSAMTVTLKLRDGSDRTYELRQGSNLIGRGNGVDLRIPDTGVSRQHADIAWDGFDAVLTDLQSTNGTTVNEIPIENWLLADGDIISLGHSEIEVRFS